MHDAPASVPSGHRPREHDVHQRARYRLSTAPVDSSAAPAPRHLSGAPMQGTPRTATVPPREDHMGSCNPGLSDSRALTVQECHTAVSTGSGDVAVLGTPTLLELAERACVAAICKDLPEGETSVGSWSEIEHLSPVVVGSQVCAEATLRGHHGSRLEFVVFVKAGELTVAKVRHRRVLVDRARFTAKIERLAATVDPAADVA